MIDTKTMEELKITLMGVPNVFECVAPAVGADVVSSTVDHTAAIMFLAGLNARPEGERNV